MEEEVEDMVGDVTYTDSQKSVALDMYSYEQSESVSTGKNTNSGRETYVLEIDDSDESDLTQAEPICAEPAATVNHSHFMKTKHMVEKVNTNNRNNNGSKIIQETFTQTSKTIIQIAQAEGYAKATRVSTLETQTSYVCFADHNGVENRTQCEVTDKNNDKGDTNNNQTKKPEMVICNFFNNSLDDESSKFAVTESENERTYHSSDITSSDVNKTSDADNSVPPLSITEVDDEDSLSYEYEESLKCETEFEQDSLMDPKRLNTIKDDCSDTSEVSLSIDQDVEELYSKLTENNGLPLDDPDASDKRMNIFVNTTLPPLAEEDPERKRSSIIVDITPQASHIQPELSTKNDVLFTNTFGMKVKLLPEEKLQSAERVEEPFKLPPIQKHISCPNSPHLNQLFTMKSMNRPVDTDTLPSIFHAPNDKLDRWNAATKHNPASGENAQISERSDLSRSGDDSNHLPPINLDLRAPFHLQPPYSSRSNKSSVSANVPRTISIKKQIRELKHSPNRVPIWRTTLSPSARAVSPSSQRSTADSEAPARACDALCADLLRRMKSPVWTETLESLEDLPNVLGKYWTTISDSRIADLIRQICSLVESPRTQVAKTACTALSVLLQNTKYTKKPDFYEAISVLLVKTGSFCRPVRRAANVALDRVACAADLAHTVTAICAHGIDHKNPLVRCAAARLLVVSVALSAGRGRELLRCRPALAAAARRCALQALARLLEDKNQDTRKYAERLYGMLRPLAKFEAFYLTDVSLETAAAQMKKHDRLLSARAGHESR